jgi:hypothetical protein
MISVGNGCSPSHIVLLVMCGKQQTSEHDYAMSSKGSFPGAKDETVDNSLYVHTVCTVQ